jgi:hypothetical protein
MEQVLERAEGQQEEKVEKKMLVIADRGADGFRISLAGKPEIFGCGESWGDALLRLLRFHQAALGLEIRWGEEDKGVPIEQVVSKSEIKIICLFTRLSKRRGLCTKIAKPDGHYSETLGCGENEREAIINMFSSPLFQKETGIEIVRRR